MVDTLEKPEQIVIPPGTSSETIITLSRKGSHQLGNPTYRGDHHVHIQVRSRQHFCQHFCRQVLNIFVNLFVNIFHQYFLSTSLLAFYFDKLSTSFVNNFWQHFLDQTAKTINGSTTRSDFRICKRWKFCRHHKWGTIERILQQDKRQSKRIQKLTSWIIVSDLKYQFQAQK